MASKRLATCELNHDNWNDEEEQEESGIFQKAAPDILQTRVIKTARRRNIESDKGSTTKIFSGFSAFGDKTSSAPPTASAFGFLSNLTNGKIEPTKTNGSSIFSNKVITPVKEVHAEEKKEKEVHSPEKPDEYYAKLKGLNQSVTQWIKSNVDENPFCILTPIFKDYERYLKEIESVNCTPNSTAPSKPSSTFTLPTKATTTSQPSTTFQIPSFETTPKAEPKEINKTSLFSFKPETSKNPFEALASKTSQDSPSFSFGSKNSLASSPSPFSFGVGKPLTIPATQSSENQTKPDDEENEEDSPPKVTFTPVVEESSVYSKRCKIFVKKDGNFTDRGTGTLYLKTVETSDKHQLVVRADTSLGNLLLNLILSDSIPIQRMGKNNVMMVCIPTPGSPSVPVLLRVKTPEEADELFETLNKFKK